MKEKFGIAALLLSSITFAVPVSAPNTLNDAPIISGGVSGGSICTAYQIDGTAINLSGGEKLVFYGGGSTVALGEITAFYGYPVPNTSVGGGFLSTKNAYSGTAYVQVRRPVNSDCPAQLCRTYRACYSDEYGEYCYDNVACLSLIHCGHGSGIGLFTRSTTDLNDFIAGAGGSFGVWYYNWSVNNYAYYTPAAGGGWAGEQSFRIDVQPEKAKVGGISIDPPGTFYSGKWFGTPDNIPQGFYGSQFAGGAASSISDFYGRSHTSVGTSFTITGGGSPGVDAPVLYVCQ